MGLGLHEVVVNVSRTVGGEGEGCTGLGDRANLATEGRDDVVALDLDCLVIINCIHSVVTLLGFVELQANNLAILQDDLLRENKW